MYMGKFKSLIITYSFVQFLDGNFITPNIIGIKVNINPFIAILVGGKIFGMLGVILGVLLLGIIKILRESVEALKPIGFLISNANPSRSLTLSMA
jgi:predicted PurR-regulated permease PerM